MAYNWGMGRLCAARMQGEQSAKFAPYEQITIADEDATSDEDSDGVPIPRKGAGWWGHGPPMATLRAGRYKAFADGNGLCSPGRWEPQKRKPVLSPMADESFGGFFEIMSQTNEVEKIFLRTGHRQTRDESFLYGVYQRRAALLL